MSVENVTSIEDSLNPKDRLDELAKATRLQLDEMAAYMSPLLKIRHELYDVKNTEFAADQSIESALYEEPTYNDRFYGRDLGVRNGGALDYHDTTEVYDDKDSELAERDTLYRKAILETAQAFGFVSSEPNVATSEIDRHIGILDSELEPISGKVEAIIINGAAGMSNIIRLRDALRNIESGAVDTNKIILSGGTRPVDDSERGRIIQPYYGGSTEFESMLASAEALVGAEFDTEYEEFSVPYGNALTARRTTAEIVVGDTPVTIIGIEAPFDNTRTLADGSPARRINTEETFLAALPDIASSTLPVVMQSHDTWTPWQQLIAEKIFTVDNGRKVYPAGPFKSDRVVWKTDSEGHQSMDLLKAQDVIDEITKTYSQLVRLSVEIENKQV